MGQRETKRRLISLVPRDGDRVVEDKESREILLIRLYTFRQDLKAVLLGREFRRYSADTLKPLGSDVDSALGSVLRLNHLYPWAVLLEIPSGLVDCHIVGPYFPNVLHSLAWNSHKILMDRDIHLTLYLIRVGAQKFKIGKQSTGDGVLDGHHSRIGRPFRHRPEKALESRTFGDIDVDSSRRVELASGLLVETPTIPLDRYSRHTVMISFSLAETSTSIAFTFASVTF